MSITNRMRPSTAVSTLNLLLVAVVLVAAINSYPGNAQVPQEVKTSFLDWASKSLHPVRNLSLSTSTEDLRPFREIIGDARIVALSEAVHAGTEPLAFRNRLFKYLVEDLGFVAIAIESGVVESRVLNDYVTEGKSELDTVITQGFSWGFDSFRQNRELLRWLREHNASLPDDATKVQIFGFDVPGSPANIAVTRGPETALESALEYLHSVDAQAGADLQRQIGRFLPVLASTDGYGGLEQGERDLLTGAIADLVALIERRRFTYIGKSSEYDYQWAEGAALGARQMDAWFRRMPLGWTVADGFEWTEDAMKVRDRAMADNLEWILSRIDSTGRVLVFGAVNHLAATPLQYSIDETRNRNVVPFGAHAKARYGSEFVNILNVVGGGDIAFCGASEPTPIELPPLSATSADTLFSSVDVSRYFLDIRRAPAPLSEWLQQEHEHRNGRFPTSNAFDLAYYEAQITSDCASQ